MRSGVKGEFRDMAVGKGPAFKACRMSAMRVSFHLTLSAWSFASCVIWHFYSAYPEYSHQRKFHLKTKCGVRSKAAMVCLKEYGKIGDFMICKLVYIT